MTAVKTIWLENPPVNAISPAVVEHVRSEISNLCDEISCIVLRGRGERAFAAGADIGGFGLLGPSDAPAASPLGASRGGPLAMSIPCGFGGEKQNRPIGLQIIGNYFDEGRLLAIADRYQHETDWHQRAPVQQG